MNLCSHISFVGLATLAVAPAAHARNLQDISEYTGALPSEAGPIHAYYEPDAGRLLLELKEWDQPLLHYVTLSSGGTWPLDRGARHGDAQPTLLRFHRVGRTVQVIEESPGHGTSDRPALAEAISASLPSAVASVLPIIASDGTTWLVDGTTFFIRDAYGVSTALGWVGESATFDPEHSSIRWPPPVDSEVSTDLEVRTTFNLAAGGTWLNSSPEPGTLTVVQRHVFLRAPTGFDPRPTNTRVGLDPVPVRDFDEVAEGGFRSGWVHRWRSLVRSDEENEQLEPLRFYLEGAIPDEHREAIARGVDYWRRTLEAIGLPGAIQLAELPGSADALDVRYPVVFLWSLRDQPLASTADLIVDPRTGELIKAVIHLDSH